ncbi:reverse transcriptase-like protein [Elysia marginata]|uniref:Reverse transcriptase-like protein n=1 Tax=Elysia marginata TaxID=1093978 RepID=A0AAV4IE39_9GAST|nr:reverse transcriptase-like protein [Elysia marginata]
MLVLLDLSAAFDIIDQDCLLYRLQKQFVIKGIALKCLASYMSERSQAVQINPSAVSSSTCLQFGVPQGITITVPVFKCLNGQGLQYLSELINSYVPNRSRRFMNENLMVIPTTNLQLGERAFPVGGPMIWDSLESHVRKSPTMAAFKKSLKTELFKRSLND